jgi:hypothetical protein
VRALQTALDKIEEKMAGILTPDETLIIKNLHLALMKGRMETCQD